MSAGCDAAALLREGGPVRVPMRECCVAALLGVTAVVGGCPAMRSEAALPGSERPPASGERRELEVPT
ncbi:MULTISPECIES: hypothetical protein [Actinoplanes]|uniref:hypothetical protein n=1 Tax=Actinoplanes TaxID=1865 RepID=UPI0005F2E556|nr:MULTISPECIES: hypothetical protein [Actinoplanes]GLY05865.1 hypothetical protein Acsp01_62440 [Actinoplanes sp. NBRC 101535]